ncbi:MAG: hypothetical protein COA79_07080 [Planctomycetota bacterium]|nr:MAG: hypothetical protein COA79_07080 [Planctomycetota bacterium]
MAIETQRKKMVLPGSKVTNAEVSAEEVLKSTSHSDCLDEILELVDLDKRKNITLYSNEYKLALVKYVEGYDYKSLDGDNFDQFILQLVLTGSVLEDKSFEFYNNLNRMALNVINVIYKSDMSISFQCAMYHMQIAAAEISMNIYSHQGKDFYLTKARQHFVMAANFVQDISALKAFEALYRISDVDIEMIMNEHDVKIIEQTIVDTHNALEFAKCLNHEKTKSLTKRYSDLCGLLSEYRVEDRDYWRDFSVELMNEAEAIE